MFQISRCNKLNCKLNILAFLIQGGKTSLSVKIIKIGVVLGLKAYEHWLVFQVPKAKLKKIKYRL
jgi:hypothetical protein